MNPQAVPPPPAQLSHFAQSGMWHREVKVPPLGAHPVETTVQGLGGKRAPSRADSTHVAKGAHEK